MKRFLHLLVLTVLAALLSTLTSPATAADPTPTVTISADRVTYTAGQTARIVFNVSGSGPGTTLRIVTTFANGSTAERTTWVTDGPQKFSLAMYINTRVRAYIDGETTPSAQRGFPVKAAVGTRPRGGFLGYSGSYAVFPRGASPVFRSTTYPERPGVRCLRHEVQKLAAAGWTTILKGSCRVQKSDGNVDWQWAGTHPSNVKFRVRATFAGDSWNQPANAPYSYFTFK